MKTPGPDHPIDLMQEGHRLRVQANGHVIADSTAVVTLREADYPPVSYFPREDVERAFLSQTAKSTHCPYKGDATYYSIFIDGVLLENVAWSYEAPYPAMETIKNLLAFYSDKVDIYRLDEG
ncbi:DUF427 domain-containing protein [soil metagenome]